MDQTGALTKILAGGVAGVSETLVTYPAEFVKTRRQLHFAPENGAAARTPPSSLSILRSTVRRSGLKGVYSGVQALAASNAAKSGIRFLAFETVRARLDAAAGTEAGRPRAAWINVVSGLSAGVAESILVVTPGEAVKTKMIHDASATGARFGNRGLMGAVGVLVREEGVRGLWSGLVPVLCKQGTNSAVRFTTFAMLQERVASWWPSLDGSVGSTLVLGGISGVFTSVDASYKGMLDCAAQTLRGDGVLAFWRGTSPRLVRLTLSSGITFTVYDQVVRWAKSMRASGGPNDLQRV
ncbi:putative mitochondrial carrier C19G12.05-like protein 1 [Colletotrichum chlorophyti]|uniref:Putative mitochondrial carrier C19G12.05-like protein 1 n=1 Tax=Colletotrichum chlorophyti TaxID=708187 RepID=A0A1Q8RTJ7_9PEZI|nr:putative mitochondrial carrier C19G12.05-like protein 1 [Colletotrichum chlorophyti]